MQLAVIMTASGMLGAGVIYSSEHESERFAAPVALISGQATLGGKIRFPSPRLTDVDGDGTREMIVGDLTGKVRVARRADAGDTLAWGELAPLTTDGAELKFNNW